jgi:hypothetical protein
MTYGLELRGCALWPPPREENPSRGKTLGFDGGGGTPREVWCWGCFTVWGGDGSGECYGMGVGYPPLTLIEGSDCPSLSQREVGGEMAAGGRPVLSRAERTSRRPVGGGSWRGKFPAPRATSSG